jgi:hypothetical protein
MVTPAVTKTKKGQNKLPLLVSFVLLSQCPWLERTLIDSAVQKQQEKMPELGYRKKKGQFLFALFGFNPPRSA